MSNVAYTIGRILVPVVFIVSGVRKVLAIGDVGKTIAATNLPIPDQITPYLGGIPKYEALAYLVAAVEIIGGLMILAGLKARWAAIVLIVFTAAATVMFHNFWAMSGDAVSQTLTDALKNLSIIGALLLIVAGGSHGRALDDRL